VTDFLVCPKCNVKKLEVFWINFPEGTVSIFHCTNCGYQGQGEPKEGQAPKEEPKPIIEEPKEENVKVIKKNLTIQINEDHFKLRPQDKDCNEKGRMCVSFRDNKNEEWRPMCEGLTFDEDGKPHFDLRKCKKHKQKEEEENKNE
jgi:Zn ribbon nucleic-acid-binding protein